MKAALTISTLRRTKTNYTMEAQKRRLALSIHQGLSAVLTELSSAVCYNNTGLYLLQRDAVRLHPRPGSSRWASVIRGDGCRRLSTLHCTMHQYICMFITEATAQLEKKNAVLHCVTINPTIKQSINLSISLFNCPCWEMYNGSG